MQSCEGRSELTATPTSPAVNSPACQHGDQRSTLPARAAQVNADSNPSSVPGLLSFCHTSGSLMPPQLGSIRLEGSIDEHDHA
jgi:hypothetical protein